MLNTVRSASSTRRVTSLLVAVVLLFGLTGCDYFSDDSPWNTPVSADATYDFARVSPFMQSPYPAGANFADFYGHPVYTAAETDPVWTVYAANYENWPLYGDSEGRPDVTVTFKAPLNLDRSGGDDGHLAVIDGDRLIEVYMGWQAPRPNPATLVFSAPYVVEQSITGDGLQGGTRAYRGAGIAGQVTLKEVQQGLIPHALPLMLPKAVLQTGWVWPAKGEDIFEYGNPAGGWGARMGEHFAIPLSVDVNTLGLTTRGAQWAATLRLYGGYNVDQADATSLGSVGLGVTSADIPTSADFEIIRALLVPVNP